MIIEAFCLGLEGPKQSEIGETEERKGLHDIKSLLGASVPPGLSKQLGVLSQIRFVLLQR